MPLRMAQGDACRKANRICPTQSLLKAPLPLRERIRSLGSLLPRRSWRGVIERNKYGSRDAIGVEQDVVVPEADDAETFAFKPMGANFIAVILGVLRSISFDYQPRPEADEIDDVIAKLLLPPELPPLQTVGAENRPQSTLRIGLVLTVAFRQVEKALPAPSPSHPLARAGPFLSRKGRGVWQILAIL